MTENKWLFIGTDDRLAVCNRIMTERGFVTHHIRTDHYTEQLGEHIVENSPRHIVFPILQMKGSIPTGLLNEDTQLYTGVASDEWLAPYKESDFVIHSYIKDEQFIWQNARLTAEAFISEYYAYSERSIAENHFHVAGFGKVGKMTAHALAALGAKVTIIARSEIQLGEASVLGYQTERLTDDFEIKEGNLVNTIPSKWLIVPETKNLHIFDLASAPGCLKKASAPEYYTVLLGLPGKHFPVDAAAALAEALERMYRR